MNAPRTAPAADVQPAILGARVLAAGNVYSRFAVIRLQLSPDAARPLPASAAQRLAEAAAAPSEWHADGASFPAFHRLVATDGPVAAAAAIEVLALLLQRWVHWPVAFAARGDGQDPGERTAVFQARHPDAGLIAGARAARLLGALRREQLDRDRWLAEVASYIQKTARFTPIYDTLAVARKLETNGIPWTAFMGNKHVRMGGGRFGKLLKGSESTDTSAIGRQLAKQKPVTNKLLARAQLPVATLRTAKTVERAIEAARRIRFPVVVKPANGNMGRGVTVDIRDEAGVADAFARAQAICQTVVIESFIAGKGYRLLVIQGKFFAAAHCRRAQVAGDGEATVRELLDRANAHPERRLYPVGFRCPIEIDAEAESCLAEQNLTLDSRPAAGQAVWLRRVEHISRGGDSFDVTDEVHLANRDVAERAASLLGIDVCGVDFVTTDLTRPWWETGGAICEVNTRPGLDVHSAVSGGTPRDAPGAIARVLFPAGAPSRIPTIVVMREPEHAVLDNEILADVRATGCRVGLANAEQNPAHASGHLAAIEAALLDTSLDALVVGISPGEIVRAGLGLEHVDLAVVPNDATDVTTARAREALTRVTARQLIATDYTSALASMFADRGVTSGDGGSAKVTTLRPAEVRSDRADRRRSPPSEFTLMLLGDLGFGESYMASPRMAALRRPFALHGYGYSLLRLRGLMASADLLVGNLEVPLAPAVNPALLGKKNYLGWSDAEQTVAALAEAGFDAVSLANNHTLDCGQPGLDATVRRLHDAEIVPFGGGRDLAAAASPFIRTIRVGPVERTIVVFGCFEFRQRYDKRYGWYARAERGGINPIDPGAIADEIRRLRTILPSPIFIAFPHWGVDYQPVQDYQRDYARHLLAAGVDLIVGHGAHVLQRVEMLDGRPVVYGIGNGAWNTPGGFGHSEAPPFGAAAAFRLSHDDTHTSATLRLYPLLVDNRLTGFQNRPVSSAEFPRALDVLLGTDEQPKEAYTQGTDKVGHYVEFAVPITSRVPDQRP